MPTNKIDHQKISDLENIKNGILSEDEIIERHHALSQLDRLRPMIQIGNSYIDKSARKKLRDARYNMTQEEINKKTYDY